ncbi:M48 family metallopeptidase [Rhizomonospora bruguierae]|uniref:M48 family metallopeptidase n=1 Tax=Rhizomonospora bruguierae TaxID=1581705 RepID=UPI001BCBE564|nr:M48 family metallopeptidase [Micromonospora sp. NBRC 107566]
MTTPRLWAAVTLAALLVALAVGAAVLIPWHRPPAPRADQLAALAQLPADRVERARAFHAELRWPGYASMAVGLVVALVIGLTPLGAWLVTQAGRPFGGHWVARAVLGGLLVVFAGGLVTLPFAAWRHTILVRYGLSTQSWGGWTADVLKSAAVSAVLGAVVLLAFFAVTRYVPRWWWAWGAAGAFLLVVLLSFVLPVLVEPVFNKFTPMASGAQREQLMALAARDGVPVKDVLVADASRRTRAVNAYVSGLGPTRRIVVYDTLLREAPPEEVASVVAHELGHAKDGDVLTGTLLGALGAAAGVAALYLLGAWDGLLRLAGVPAAGGGGADTVAGGGVAGGATGPGGFGDPRAIGLLLAVGAVAGLVMGPAQSLVSRRIEARADAHALALTRDPATFTAMQRRLSLVNLGDPDPPAWEQALFGSHPTAVERMAAAAAYARGER